MATKKNAEADTGNFDQAVEMFADAIRLFQQVDFSAARDAFAKIVKSVKDEPVLVHRSRMYLAICEKRLEAPIEPSSAPEDVYYRAVVESNSGNTTEAIKLLDQALQQDPNSAKLLYARASAWALSANPDSAVNDLRKAIAVDPKVRFQAINDADFERIREEPGFIDIIEPTPTGV